MLISCYIQELKVLIVHKHEMIIDDRTEMKADDMKIEENSGIFTEIIGYKV
jgi:hypothetical protein